MDAGTIAILLKANDQASAVLRDAGTAADGLGTKLDEVGTKAGAAATPTGTLHTSLGKLSLVAGGFVVGAALTQLPGMFSGIASGAATLEQNARKAQIVFGDSLGTVESWASTAASGMGLTNQEAVTLAAGMADLLVPMGFSREQAAGMSTDTLNLAGALSEWSGGTTSASEAADILAGAMLGEYDALKGLGIGLSAAEVAQRAADNAAKGLTFATEDQANAFATQQLIMEKSKDAQVAFATSTDDVASRQAEASAQMATAGERMQNALLPAVSAGTTLFLLLATALNGGIVPAFVWLMNVLSPVGAFIGDNLTPILIIVTPLLLAAGGVILAALVPAFIAWAAATWAQVAAALGLNAAMLPWIALLLAIGVVVAALYLAWNSNFLGIRDIVMSVIDWMMPYLQVAWDTIKAGVDAVLGGIQTAWDTVWPYLSTALEVVFGVIQTVIGTYFDAWKLIITTALDVIKGAWDLIWPAIQAVVETVFPIIETVVRTYIDLVVAAIQTALGIITAIWDPFWNGLQVVIDTVWPLIQSAVELAIAAVQAVIDTTTAAIKLIWDPFWEGIKSTVDTIFNAAGGVIEVVSTAVGAVKGKIEDAKDGIVGAWNAIWGPVKDAISGVKDFVSGVVDDIIGIVNGVIGSINGVIGRINSALNFTVDIPDAIPGLPDEYTVSVDIPTISPIGGGGGSGGGGGGSFNAMSAAGAGAGTGGPSAMGAAGGAGGNYGVGGGNYGGGGGWRTITGARVTIGNREFRDAVIEVFEEEAQSQIGWGS